MGLTVTRTNFDCLICGVSVGCLCGPHFVEGGVLFSLVAPEANEVELVGSFNGWDLEHRIPLSRNPNGVWHATLDLPPGRHLYKYVIDGVWRPDPANENRTAPNEDCVVEVYRRD